MVKSSILVGLIVLETLFSAGHASAQERPATKIQAQVDLVRLAVGVVNRSGGPVPVLGPEDFAVFDNGVEQEVRLVLRPEEAPLRVALAFDSSSSMRLWELPMRRAALTFLSALGPDDCAYVLPFSERIGPGRWDRGISIRWMPFLQRLEFGSETLLHDALIVAITQLEWPELALASVDDSGAAQGSTSVGNDLAPIPAAVEAAATQPPRISFAALRLLLQELTRNQPPTLGDCGTLTQEELPAETRRAILLLSDGEDTGSRAGVELVMTTARAANVSIFPVVLGLPGHRQETPPVLTELAGATGGIVIQSTAVGELPGAYKEALAVLHSSYVLAYDPDKVSGTVDRAEGERRWHDVRVELRRPLLRAIVRPGYYR